MFNTSDSGGLARMAAFITLESGSPPPLAGRFQIVELLPFVINENIFHYAVVSQTDVRGNYITNIPIGTTVSSATFEISGDNGTALLNFMNTNFTNGLNKVQSIDVVVFENLPLVTVVQSN